MTTWLRQLLLEIKYFRNPPWDTGITPPELQGFIQSHPPGQALDLGCGTGTNLVALARAGWQVTGVDISRRAVHLARRRLKTAALPAVVRAGDVTKLDWLTAQFDLLVDIGCYHQLDSGGRIRYRAQVARLSADGATFLLYAHWRSTANRKSHGILEDDLEQFSRLFRLAARQDGQEGARGPSTWLTYLKESR